MPLARPALAPARHPLERLPEEWVEHLAQLGQPRFRGKQVFRWIHHRGVFDPAEMTDLPLGLRERLAEELDAHRLPQVRLDEPASDGTRKLLLALEDANEIETVLIPQRRAEDPDRDDDLADEPELDAKARVTQCVSTQVGCAMGCRFCASGVMGLNRHLSAAEIVSQALVGRSLLRENERLSNIVLMGMGEPLHNYENVARALVLLTHADGMNLSDRRITLSTSGLVPEIDRLGADFAGRVQLAISLHAVTDERRSALMPVNRKYPLKELVACLKRYPMPRRRRITIEYTLIAGENDSPADADRLVSLLRGIPVKVNLIPMNSVSNSDLRGSSERRVDAFQQRLLEQGISTFVRRRRGDEIAAACGQLVARSGRRTRRQEPAAPEAAGSDSSTEGEVASPAAGRSDRGER